MTIHDATEVAYKNGYAAGKRDAMKWIPVTERLPSYGEQVLIIDARFEDFAIWSLDTIGGKDWWVDGRGWRFLVTEATHWMPLPEPPKEDA